MEEDKGLVRVTFSNGECVDAMSDLGSGQIYIEGEFKDFLESRNIDLVNEEITVEYPVSTANYEKVRYSICSGKFDKRGNFIYGVGIHPNGDVYEGRFNGSSWLGPGKFYLCNGSTFEGEFNEIGDAVGINTGVLGDYATVIHQNSKKNSKDVDGGFNGKNEISEERKKVKLTLSDGRYIYAESLWGGVSFYDSNGNDKVFTKEGVETGETLKDIDLANEKVTIKYPEYSGLESYVGIISKEGKRIEGVLTYKSGDRYIGTFNEYGDIKKGGGRFFIDKERKRYQIKKQEAYYNGKIEEFMNVDTSYRQSIDELHKFSKLSGEVGPKTREVLSKKILKAYTKEKDQGRPI